MNKPTIPVLPNEVAELIEALRDPEGGHVFTNAEIVVLATKTGGGLHRDTVTLQSISFDTLMAALVNGYEREMTEEERLHKEIRDMYDKHRRGDGIFVTADEDRAYADGVAYTLDALGIQIEGVNA